MHPIEQAQRLLNDSPIQAVDAALRALRITAEERREAKTAAYLDILARAILRASAVEHAAGEDPVIAMLESRNCDRLACAALLRVLILDDSVFAVDARLRGAKAL